MSALPLCHELVLLAHLWSAHFEYRLREETFGAGVECRRGEISAAIGALHNSYDRPSVYAVAGMDLLRAGPMHVGAAIGVATGYHDVHDTPLLGGLRLRMAHERLEATVLASPPFNGQPGVVHLVMGWRLR